MKISIFGLGYVGAVTAGCLAEQGHQIVGVDVHPQKVEEFNRGQAPIVEPELDRLLAEAKERGALKATTECRPAIRASDVSLICVGTPSALSGALDLGFVRQVTEQIAQVLREEPKPHVLIFRSTMLPGTTRQLVREFLADLPQPPVVLFFPEFLREGSAVADFREPALAVVGTENGEPFGQELKGLLGAKTSAVTWETAEMVKYACNAFHATKITFANEIGRLGKSMGVDARQVMALLCQDWRLNLSPYYMRPGNPFGGSCLPKDVRALGQYGRQNGLHLPLLENLLVSNHQHLGHLLELILQSGQREVVILGLSFKSQTDDLRESAMVEVAQQLLGRGYPLRIFDPQLNLGRLVGSNKRMIDIRMPHLASLLREDLGEALGSEGLVVAAQACADVAELGRRLTERHHVLDINGWPGLKEICSHYQGFCW